MKKTLNLGLVLSILALLACEDDDNCVQKTRTSFPPQTEMTIYTMQPASGHNGDEITVLVEGFPEVVRYQNQTQDQIYNSPFDYDDENAPWVEAYVGGDRADIVSAFREGVTIEIPPFLDPGEHQVQLTIGSHRVEAPGKLRVLDPAL